MQRGFDHELNYLNPPSLLLDDENLLVVEVRSITMKVYLKVRIKELAEEARIIRAEEHKAKSARKYGELTGLNRHRIDVVRPAARSAQLAYGFLRGRPYRTMERTCRIKPSMKEIRRLVSKYGSEPDTEKVEKQVEAWLDQP